MSGNYYRRNLTLNDLLSGQASETQAPVAPNAAPPQNLAGEGGLSAQERTRLLDVLMQPQDIGPPPDVEEVGTGRRVAGDIFAGIGDSLGTYAAILGGGRPPDYMRELYAKREFDKAKKQQYGERKARAENEAKQRTAQFLLGEDKDRLDRMAAKAAEEKADRLLREKIKRDADEAIAGRTFELTKQAEEHRLDREEQEATFRHENGRIRLEASLKDGKDPKAAQALKDYSLGAKIANGFVRGLPDENVPPLVNRLMGDPDNQIPPQTPDQIRKEHEDEMTAAGIFGPARDMSRDYFNERLIRAYREAQKQLQAKAAGQ